MTKLFMITKSTVIKRVYAKKDVSDMTLEDVENYITSEGIDYSADYGFKVSRGVHLISSLN